MAEPYPTPDFAELFSRPSSNNRNVTANSAQQDNGVQWAENMDQPGEAPLTDALARVIPRLQTYADALIAGEQILILNDIACLIGPIDIPKFKRFVAWIREMDRRQPTMMNEQRYQIIIFANVMNAAIQLPEEVRNPLDQIIDDCEKLGDYTEGHRIPQYHKEGIRPTGFYHYMFGHYIQGLVNPPYFGDVSIKQIVERFGPEPEKNAWEEDLEEKSTFAKHVPDYTLKMEIVRKWMERYPELTLAKCTQEVLEERVMRAEALSRE